MSYKRLKGGFERFERTVQKHAIQAVSLVYHLLYRLTRNPTVEFTFQFLNDYRDHPVDLRTALTIYRRGFLVSSYHQYDLETYAMEEYVSDFSKLKYGWSVNEPASEYLNDKKRFYELLEERGHGELLPDRYGSIDSGVLRGAGKDFVALFHEKERLIVKGRRGGSGHNVYVCSFDGESYRANGDSVVPKEFADSLTDQEYLVTEYCQPAAYARSIYPGAAHSVRVITMNPDDGDPFIAFSTQKIATDRSAPIDNVSKGALSIEIDEDGTLGPAFQIRGETVDCHDEHPDTGVEITGTEIPGWNEITSEILSVTAAVPELRYIGWDLIVTDGGEFKIIEGNANSGVELQVHRPLLVDSRVCSFYENHRFPPNEPLF